MSIHMRGTFAADESIVTELGRLFDPNFSVSSARPRLGTATATHLTRGGAGSTIPAGFKAAAGAGLRKSPIRGRPTRRAAQG
jgi:hypothetical protein